jgi:hypothetical protein
VCDFVSLEADGSGSAHAGEEGDVVEFAHHAFEQHPREDAARGGVDKPVATRLGALGFERGIQRQALESSIFARQRQPDGPAKARPRAWSLRALSR